MKSYIAYLFVSLQLGSLSVLAQEPPATTKRQPSPEMQKLFNTFLGTWSVSEKIEPSKSLPNGGVGEGEEVYRVGPGAVSLVEEIQLKEPTGKISGLGVGWWDAKGRGYKAL